MPAVRTPEASRPTRRIAVPRCSLPRRGIGSAASITFDFGANHPFTCVPACNLSVYASQWLTPRKTRYTAAWLRLCRGRHFRRLNSTRLQGATLTKPDVTLSMSSGFPVPFFRQVGIDDPNIFGNGHCGYLYTLVIRHPSPGFPVRGLLRPLRRPRGL